jgi:hypothetical protein
VVPGRGGAAPAGRSRSTLTTQDRLVPGDLALGGIEPGGEASFRMARDPSTIHSPTLVS